ncbi:MAG: hypothetical protein AAGJ73_01145 [Pseudomonadota bacterium]
MIRITMIFLCLILAAAAAGRYQAEVRVKQAREELKSLEAAKAREVAEIQMLRAEVAYLEGPERLADIADKATALKPLTGAQLMTADDFAVAFGAPSLETPKKPESVDTILHAIAMADGAVSQ